MASWPPKRGHLPQVGGEGLGGVMPGDSRKGPPQRLPGPALSGSWWRGQILV